MATIKNLDSLTKKLNNIAALDISAALELGALRVVRDAKLLVPVDTGILRSSITHDVQGNIATVGTPVEYAPKVELGLGQRAQPYLQPALVINREAIKQDVATEVQKQLRGKAK